MAPYPVDVQPGDFFVVNSGGELAEWIGLGQRLIDGKGSKWDHAGIASRWDDKPVYDVLTRDKLSDRTLYIVQAEPKGAREVPWYWGHCPHAWSTGIVPTCLKAGENSRLYQGVGYSFLDYLAIADRKVPLLGALTRGYVSNTGHMICSQLVARARFVSGCGLYSEWTGYVKPSDLGFLLP